MGRLSFVRHHLDLPPEASDPHEETSTSGRTQVYVASSSQGLLGRLEFEDALREDARAVVRSLQRQVRFPQWCGLRLPLLFGAAAPPSAGMRSLDVVCLCVEAFRMLQRT